MGGGEHGSVGHPFLEKNKKAIAEFKKIHQKIEDEYSNDAGGMMNFIRLLGLRCSICGGDVTGSNFQFYKFKENVTCYNCQHI